MWVPHTTVCHSLFPFPFSPSYCATGVFLPHMDMHTHEHMHAHTNAVHHITVLIICRVLIESPLSPSCTCISSLIISQGAFGGAEGEDSQVPSCTSTDLTEWTFAAGCCLITLPLVEICPEQNVRVCIPVFSTCWC